MDLIAYYDSPQGIGNDALEDWVRRLIGQDCTFKALPSGNNNAAFAQLPSYVADILYLDKPDVIVSGNYNGFERPICSIELASCTPQYQHAVQRFSRMLASVANGCPSVVIMPSRKRENSGGDRVYNRSPAISYGASRLMDIYDVPAFVVDWPDVDGLLVNEQDAPLPSLTSASMIDLARYLKGAISVFESRDYLASLRQRPETRRLLERTRYHAYSAGIPTIAAPGGGADGRANLELIPTDELIQRMLKENRADPTVVGQIPQHIRDRSQSLVFAPTRIVKKAGDPYVGMLSYYDIAFCRVGKSSRERDYNLVAYCNGVSIAEIQDSMKSFNSNRGSNGCPFVEGVNSHNMLRYSYHLKHGCSKTKTKPLRIYAELADVVCFSDGIIVNV